MSPHPSPFAYTNNKWGVFPKAHTDDLQQLILNDFIWGEIGTFSDHIVELNYDLLDYFSSKNSSSNIGEKHHQNLWNGPVPPTDIVQSFFMPYSEPHPNRPFQ